MLAERDIGARDEPVEAVVDHPLRSVSDFLGRLEQGDHSAAPLFGRHGQKLSGAEQAGDVHVMTTGVHDRSPARGDGTGIRQVGRFADRQGVHVGTEQDRRPVPVGQHADHPGSADPLVDLVAVFPEPGGHQRRGAVLLMGQLGIGVQIPVEVLLPIPDGSQLGEHGRHPRRTSHVFSLSTVGPRLTCRTKPSQTRPV